MAHPMCLSISTIFSTELASSRVDVTLFSTPRMTPSEVATYMGSSACWQTILILVRPTPIAVEPSLMASREYSTWNKRPSGEKVLE